eukprot:1140840-Pelagomonas_calceolata.AAC.10
MNQLGSYCTGTSLPHNGMGTCECAHAYAHTHTHTHTECAGLPLSPSIPAAPPGPRVRSRQCSWRSGCWAASPSCAWRRSGPAAWRAPPPKIYAQKEAVRRIRVWGQIQEDQSWASSAARSSLYDLCTKGSTVQRNSQTVAVEQ